MGKKVYIIHKTHLDIGFTDLAKNVIDSYINDFIPRAINLGEEMGKDFVWTTGSWLIDYYLNSSEVDDNMKRRMENALRNGTIAWHALPFTTHTELMDKKLFEYSLLISKELDKKYNKKTIAAKMTDIPGHTIAMVPILAKAGVKYLHIGVNPSSAVPHLPEMFLWRAEDGSEIVVHYDKDYGGTFERDNWEEVLYFAHSHDNQGPPKEVDEVNKIHKKIYDKYPKCEAIPSTLNEFANIAWERRNELPVIKEEIGDSWIHGVGTDPRKISEYKTLLKLRDKWICEGTMDENSDEYNLFSKKLLLVAEHTWGANANLYLPEYKNYLIKDFEKAREEDKIIISKDTLTNSYSDLMMSINTYVRETKSSEERSYKFNEKSWEEQRQYISEAINVLNDNHKNEVLEKLKLNIHRIENIKGQNPVEIGKKYKFNGIELIFTDRGSISYLSIEGKNMIIKGKEYGSLSYERFDSLNFNKYLHQYSRINQNTGSWVLVDFAKRGIEAYSEIKNEIIHPHITKSEIIQNEDIFKVNFDLEFENIDIKKYGLPKVIRVEYNIDTQEKIIDTFLRCRDKKANRMPEAYWFECSLSVDNPYAWKMNKLGYAISPYNIVKNGNRGMHALDRKSLTYEGAEGLISIGSEITPLFSFGGRRILNFDNSQRSLNEGIFINLYNNVWGTNFPSWYEGQINCNIKSQIKINEHYMI